MWWAGAWLCWWTRRDLPAATRCAGTGATSRAALWAAARTWCGCARAHACWHARLPCSGRAQASEVWETSEACGVKPWCHKSPPRTCVGPWVKPWRSEGVTWLQAASSRPIPPFRRPRMVVAVRNGRRDQVARNPHRRRVARPAETGAGMVEPASVARTPRAATREDRQKTVAMGRQGSLGIFLPHGPAVAA